jgi:acyl carrier protein
MTFSSLSFTPRTSAREGSEAGQIRALVAKHLGVDIERVTDEAHFSDDLGADWLDRLELLILIEDQFAGLEILDGDADQIEVVGDLIRYIEDARVGSITGRVRPLPMVSDLHDVTNAADTLPRRV